MAGDLARRVPAGGSDTISWLATEFNTMADSMTGLVGDLRAERERLAQLRFDRIGVAPLGATVGDLLDKPIGSGGFEVSRPLASLVLAVAIVVLVWLIPQRAGRHPGSDA